MSRWGLLHLLLVGVLPGGGGDDLPQDPGLASGLGFQQAGHRLAPQGRILFEDSVTEAVDGGKPGRLGDQFPNRAWNRAAMSLADSRLKVRMRIF